MRDYILASPLPGASREGPELDILMLTLAASTIVLVAAEILRKIAGLPETPTVERAKPDEGTPPTEAKP